jgi:hypothetical protein
MQHAVSWSLGALCAAWLVTGCVREPSPAAATADAGSQAAPAAAQDELVGAWRTKVQFSSGAFASVQDLELLYVYNVGGTMTESSNYDGAPPVAPAYGVWRQTGPRQYETRYMFFQSQPPASLDLIMQGGGWMPAGHGVLDEKITLAEDGQSYTSTLTYAAFGQSGAPVAGGGSATAMGQRITFDAPPAG